ncbi:Uma2 family endonuclease [Trichothermofontia sp.]
MVRTPAPIFSLETFLKLLETQPASEYIEGKIIQKPMSQGKHSRLQKRLIYKLEAVLLSQGIAEAFPELRCSFGGKSIVPDVVVLQNSHIPYDANDEIANLVERAPDWTIEILSPEQDYKKVTSNILHCLEYGCQMGWLIDPDEKTVVALPQNSRSRLFAQPDATLPVPDWAKI